MIVQLQPTNIATYWPGIKRALLASNAIKEEEQEKWLLFSLNQLLAGKLQCWLAYELAEEEGQEVRKLHIMIVTSIINDRLFGYNYLTIEALYGFRSSTDELWLEALEGLKTFCRNSDCKYIKALTNNERAKEIADKLGFFDFSSYYSMEV